MNKLCCIRLSLAARIIGTYTMSLSVLMINVLMSDYFSRTIDNEFFDSIGNWRIFGLNWIQVVKNSQIERKEIIVSSVVNKFVYQLCIFITAETALVFFLFYAILFLVLSAYLALGSISRRPKCAVPWLYLQMISIIDQTAALSIHLTHGSQYDAYDRSIWYIPVSSVYLLSCTYFWLVVHAARREWSIRREASDDIDLRETAPTGNNEPKSPSFLSQNFAKFQSPRPSTILPK